MIKKMKAKINKTDIPYMINQNKLSVEIRLWQGEHEQRYDLLFRTENSYVSLSLSREQMILLKEKLKDILL